MLYNLTYTESLGNGQDFELPWNPSYDFAKREEAIQHLKDFAKEVNTHRFIGTEKDNSFAMVYNDTDGKPRFFYARITEKAGDQC